MKFVNPNFLYALAFIAVPILIHLFNFRRYKIVYFSNTALLNTLKRESKRRSRLKELLILLMRILAIACLVVAFAQPYIPYSDEVDTKVGGNIAIYIDNSFSMQVNGETGPLIEEARSMAVEIANTASSGSMFMLISNDLSPENRRLVSKEEFLQNLSKITFSHKSPSYKSIFSYINSVLRETGASSLYLLSDFQQNSFALDDVEVDSTYNIYVAKVKSDEIRDVSVDSCWFDSPGRTLGKSNSLKVKFKNHGSQPIIDLPVRFYINDTLKTTTTTRIGAQSDTTISIIYTSSTVGIKRASVEINDLPVSFDDKYFLSYEVSEHINVTELIDGQSKHSNSFARLYNLDDFFRFKQLDYRNFKTSDLIFTNTLIINQVKAISTGLANAISKYVEEGGAVIYVPSNNLAYEKNKYSFFHSMGLLSYIAQDSSSSSLGRINFNDIIYKDVFEKRESNGDLPKLKGTYRLSRGANTSFAILSMLNGETALGRVNVGQGQVYMFSFPLSENNEFTQDVIFVPTAYNIAMNSIPYTNLSYSLSSDYVISGRTSEIDNLLQLVVKHKDQEGRYTVERRGVGEYALNLSDALNTHGFYDINSESGDEIKSLAYNYSRNEADFRTYSSEHIISIANDNSIKNIDYLGEGLKDLTSSLEVLNSGNTLWKLFLILCVLFILCESIVIRFMR
ncbi:MAG: BatA domain-containing protein [Bacteroidales bacterium]